MQSIGELATLVSLNPFLRAVNLSLTDCTAPNIDPYSRFFPALGDSVYRPGCWLLPRSVSNLFPRILFVANQSS
jgi:hypothetical protein